MPLQIPSVSPHFKSIERPALRMPPIILAPSRSKNRTFLDFDFFTLFFLPSTTVEDSVLGAEDAEYTDVRSNDVGGFRG